MNSRFTPEYIYEEPRAILWIKLSLAKNTGQKCWVEISKTSSTVFQQFLKRNVFHNENLNWPTVLKNKGF